jgi:hypothetical protein
MFVKSVVPERGIPRIKIGLFIMASF